MDLSLERWTPHTTPLQSNVNLTTKYYKHEPNSFFLETSGVINVFLDLCIFFELRLVS